MAGRVLVAVLAVAVTAVIASTVAAVVRERNDGENAAFVLPIADEQLARSTITLRGVGGRFEAATLCASTPRDSCANGGGAASDDFVAALPVRDGLAVVAIGSSSSFPHDRPEVTVRLADKAIPLVVAHEQWVQATPLGYGLLLFSVPVTSGTLCATAVSEDGAVIWRGAASLDPPSVLDDGGSEAAAERAPC